MSNWQKFLNWEQSTRDTIDVKKIYIDIAGGDLVAGILLSQIIYWFLPDKNGDCKLRVEKDNTLWLTKKRTDWYDECRISTKQYDRAIKLLKRLGLVETKLYKINGSPQTCIKLNQDRIMELIDEKLEPVNLPKGDNGIPQKGKLEFTQRGNSNLPKGEKPINNTNSNIYKTETTKTEITNTENTKKERVDKVKKNIKCTCTNKYIRQKTSFFDKNSQQLKLAKLLFEKICENNPLYKNKKPNLNKWAEYIDKLHRIDKIPYELIEKVIIWCQQDKFWKVNILSTDKLRKQFHRLYMQMQEDEKSGKFRVNSDLIDEFGNPKWGVSPHIYDDFKERFIAMKEKIAKGLVT